jgi:hypothetical protein
LSAPFCSTFWGGFTFLLRSSAGLYALALIKEDGTPCNVCHVDPHEQLKSNAKKNSFAAAYRCAKTCIVIPSSIFVVFLQAVSICTNNEQLNE